MDNTRYRRPVISWLALAVVGGGAACAVPASLLAQGAVSGRVSISERPGERTKDLNSTVIYLSPKDSASASTRPVVGTIAMNGRAFVPHVRVVTMGSRIAFPNEDPFSHNIFSSAPGTTFDLGLYPSGKSKDALFRRLGAVAVYCNIHPLMTAFIVVVPSSWYAQAGNDGRWSIEGVPAGDYTLTVWHERTQSISMPITVGATDIAGMTTALDARGYRPAEHKNKFGREYDKNAIRY